MELGRGGRWGGEGKVRGEVGRKVKGKVRKRWGGGKVVDMFWHSRV